MKKRRPPCRRGAVLVAAMVCLLVAMSLIATMLAGSLARRVQLKAERNARQAALLVVAARDLAAKRLADDAAYEGETWTPEVGAESASVDIESSEDEEGLARVEVTVTYPANGPRTVRRSQTFYLPLPNPSGEE